MTLNFGDRVPTDGTIRCERCGHGIALLGGGTVPRCYCGGEAFAHQPRPGAASTPRPAKLGDLAENARGYGARP